MSSHEIIGDDMTDGINMDARMPGRILFLAYFTCAAASATVASGAP